MAVRVFTHDRTETTSVPAAALRERYREFEWVIDGTQDPPVAIQRTGKGGRHKPLRPAEYKALIRLVHRRSVEHDETGLEPKKLFEDANSAKAAARRFEKARRKLEPKPRADRASQAFKTVGRGVDKRYVFAPPADLRYAIFEQVADAVRSDSPEPRAFPGRAELLALAQSFIGDAAAKPPPNIVVRGSRSGSVDVEVGSVRHLRGQVFVECALVNRAKRDVVIDSAVMKIGGVDHAALRARGPVPARMLRALHPWMLTLAAGRASRGTLVFRAPTDDGPATIAVTLYGRPSLR